MRLFLTSLLFLVARDGRRVQSFDTRVAPEDPGLAAAIEALLGGD